MGILSALQSGRSVTLHAIRRIGKTGLIKHVFHQLKDEKNVSTLYVDVFDTINDQQFTQKLINAIFSLIKDQQTINQKIIGAFAKYRPRLSIDSITGNPSIQLDIAPDDPIGPPITEIFRFLNLKKSKVYIAIDEFQQIEKYEQSQVSATLRTIMQTYPHVQFIFSGSQRNLLLDLFTSPKKALFRSTQLMGLEKIPAEAYNTFIRHHFKQGNKSITYAQINDILDWTCTHTFYTQYYCNKLYGASDDIVKDQNILEIKTRILKENEIVFYNYKNLMTHQQWKLLEAIAQEGTMIAVTSKKFLSKYHLGAHATVRRSLKFLLDNEFIYTTIDMDTEKPIYHLYDPFLMRWVQQKYIVR